MHISNVIVHSLLLPLQTIDPRAEDSKFIHIKIHIWSLYVGTKFQYIMYDCRLYLVVPIIYNW